MRSSFKAAVSGLVLGVAANGAFAADLPSVKAHRRPRHRRRSVGRAAISAASPAPCWVMASSRSEPIRRCADRRLLAASPSAIIISGPTKLFSAPRRISAIAASSAQRASEIRFPARRTRACSALSVAAWAIPSHRAGLSSPRPVSPTARTSRRAVSLRLSRKPMA